MARRKRKFSAITGRRLEYWVPGSVLDALGAARAMAVCVPSADQFLIRLKYTADRQGRRASVAEGVKARYTDPSDARAGSEYAARVAKKYERSGKLATNKASSMLQLLEQATAEEAKLRKNGVTGAIPVCVYRAGGKKAGTERFERRSTAMHERFHAKVRRFEADKGIKRHGLAWPMEARLKDEFGPLGKEALGLAQVEKWASTRDGLTEEILARVEEIRQSCVRSKTDCQAIKDQFARREQRVSGKYRLGGESLTFDHTMERLTDAIAAKYSGAMGFVGAVQRGMSAGGTFRGFARLPKAGRIPMAQVQRAMKSLGRKVKACGITPALLREGMAVEREHRDVTGLAAGKTARIAASHLCERRDYYKRIKRYVEK